MKIALEALGIHSYGGGRTATINLLQALFSIDKNNKYVLFMSHHEEDLIASNVTQTVIPIKNRFLSRIWAQTFLPSLTSKFNLVHFLKNMGVEGIAVPEVITIYDMTTLLFPNLFPAVDVWYWRNIQKHALKKAAKIIAISQQTAQDIRFFYELPEEKIAVIYPSCGRHFKPAEPKDILRIRNVYDLPKNYILHVGRIDPKKNIPILIEAFDLFRKRTSYLGKLVIVGEQYKKKPDHRIHEIIENLELVEVVILPGAVPDSDLPAIYTGADITVFPSIHEGFGLVALEALSCGVPLIVNNSGAIKEVVGNAAIVLEEGSATLLADLMKNLWNDPEKKLSLKKAGLMQAKQFSWERNAQETLKVYEEVVKGR